LNELKAISKSVLNLVKGTNFGPQHEDPTWKATPEFK